MKTGSLSTFWEIEVFAFKNPQPSVLEDDFEAKGDKTQASSALSFGNFAIPDSSANIGASNPQDGTDSSVNIGVTNISFQRAKDRPDCTAVFTVSGPVHPYLVSGSWLIIKSYKGKDKSAATPRLIKFIGQITSLQSIDNIDDRRNISTMTSFNVSEWSRCLTMAVKLNFNSLYRDSVENEGFGSKNTSFKAYADRFIGNDKANEIFSKAYKPFEMIHLALDLVGAINADDKINTIDELQIGDFSEVALRMPSVPRALLRRLGVSATYSDTGNIFKSGMVKVITGAQIRPFQNDGEWNGFLSSINDYQGSFDQNPKDRPASNGLGVLTSLNLPAWSIIQQFADPSVNEVYTDFLYETKGSSNEVTSQPVIMVRDKPFILNSLIRDGIIPSEYNIADSFTIYDNLPRIRIDNVFIKEFTRRNSIVNSPNYIMVNWNAANQDGATNSAQIRATPPVKLDAEMRRFGGNELDLQTSYLSTDSSGQVDTLSFISENGQSMPAWAAKLRQVAKGLYAYDYRFLHGELKIKDDNFPISLGMNVQFEYGEFDLVGQVNSISTTHQVLPDGNRMTETSLGISHIVMDTNDGLSFISPEDFGNLLQATPKTPPPIVMDSFSQNSILSKFNAALDFVKGLFS